MLTTVSPPASAEECPVEGTLVAERMHKGIFRRTYEFRDCRGNISYSSTSIVFGVDGTEDWTELQAKQALLEQGRGDLLVLFPGVTVAPEVIRQWQEEGYNPEIEMESAARQPLPDAEPGGPVPTLSLVVAEEQGQMSSNVTTPASPTDISTSFEPAPYEDPTSALYLTEEREAELERLQGSGADDPVAPARESWWQRVINWLLGLWRNFSDWIRNLAGKEGR